jgi:hypothetical protein|tara:strand:- start:769 stop:1122 length:354 start_codon:yes stop_codon:yes gene_type:complete
MVWTTPRTWVSGEVVTAGIMNTHVRDQFTFFSVHLHDGNAGQGSAHLGGVSGISHIVFSDSTADPTGIGEMQMNGTLLKYHDGTGVILLGRDAAAGTASFRTLGAGATQAAAGDHTH